MNEKTYQKEAPQKEALAVLQDFCEAVFPKVSDSFAIPDILERIQEWVGDDPVLTTTVCDFVIKYPSQINQEDAEALVDQVVYEEIIADWENNAAAAHLTEIRDTLLGYDRRDSLLILYIKIFQRGKVCAENTPEQSVLLRSGLVRMNRGKLKIANTLYKRVFSMEWVERQLPGITRPVSIVTTQSNSGQFWSSIPLLLKVATVVGGLAAIAVTAAFYLRSSNGPAMATQDAVEASESILPEVEAVSELAARSDVDLFDAGIEHGKNGRWVPMLRDFCEIEKGSIYFAPAKNQLAQWERLFPEGFKTAVNTRTYEMERSGGTCLVIEDE